MSTTLQLMQDEQARALLADTEFQRDWQALYDRCAWSTPFQSPTFTRTWFAVYREQSPIIVRESNGAGTLSGLLALTRTPAGRIAVAGTHHAEYKGWLEAPGHETGFIARALDAVRSGHGAYSLDLSFLRHEAQAMRLRDTCSRAEIHITPREFRVLSADSVLQSLKKKGNRSKFNRLARLGTVEFRRLSNAAQFRHYLEICSIYHDVWQGGVHNVCPFHDDPAKLEFHARLFEASPDLLHVTVLLVDAAPVAMHIGYARHGEVVYSIVAHHPGLHQYSLGKLQMLKVAERLLEEGFEELDLSPGREEWKRNFASGEDSVYTVFIHGGALQKHLSLWRGGLKRLLKRAAVGAGLNPGKIRTRLREWRRGQRHGQPQREAQVIYHLPGGAQRPVTAELPDLRRDALADLLLYRQATGTMTRQQFLAEATRRLGEGEHVYTWTESGRLLCYGWLAPRPESLPAEAMCLQQSGPPGETALIHDIRLAGAAAGSGLYAAMARRMLQDAFAIEGTTAVCAACPSGDAAAGAVFVDQLGFRLLDDRPPG